MSNEGGSAFPHARPMTSAERQQFHATNPPHVSAPGVMYEGGMTLRDYFAAKAMQTAQIWNLMQPLSEWMEGMHQADSGLPFSDSDIAQAAYAMADAMLKERAK